jgi:hypothetical protein
MIKTILTTLTLAAVLASHSIALTIDDFKPTSLSGSGKTLELSIEGDELGPNPGPTWTLTFDKTPANQATILNFPGNTAASTCTWAYTGAPFKDAHGYAFTATNAFGNKPASIDFWISTPGARFYLNYDGKSYYGGVALKPIDVPEITIQQPTGKNLKDGKSMRSFGSVSVGQTSAVMTFTIRNSGKSPLSNLAIKKGGANKKDFIVTDPGKTTLAPGAKTTFKVTFKPKAKNTRSANIAVTSNDADENPFNIKLTGQGLK